MNFKARLLSIFLILCMVAGIAVNARSEQSIFEEYSFFSNKTTVRLWYTDDAITPYLQSVAVSYSESKKDVRIEPKLVSGIEYLEAINKASLEGGNYPDIFVTTNDTLEKAYFAGLALEADNTDGFFNKVLFPKAALDAVTCNGRYVAYPFYFETSALLYNKTYLDEHAKELAEKAQNGGDSQEKSDESAEESSEGEDAAAEESSEASEEVAEEESDEASDADSSEEGEEAEEAEEIEEEDAEAEAEEETTEEETVASAEDVVPTTVKEILGFAGEYTAPDRVRTVFEWDVTDIFYNYFFVGNYMNIGGDTGDDSNTIDIYNGNTISCMEIYRALKQFFATDASTVSYEQVANDFIEGKIVFTIATTDIFQKIENKAVLMDSKGNLVGGDGLFFEYGVAPIPDLDETYKTRTMSVTNCMVVNGFSEHPQEANDFARYICSDTSDDIYKMSHKLAAHYGIDYGNDGLNTFVDVYAGSVSMPKIIQASNFWMELEIAFTKIWDDSENDVCNTTLKELSEMIKTQVKGENVVEQTIPTPPTSLITAGLKEDSD